MNRTATRLTALALSAAAVLVTAPAHAQNRPVTYPEYHRIHRGMYRAHVEHVFHNKGRWIYAYTGEGAHAKLHEGKQYKTDTSDTVVQVNYVGPIPACLCHLHRVPLKVRSKELVTP